MSLMDTTKCNIRKRQQQSKEKSVKPETTETPGNGKRNAEQNNRADCSKKLKPSANEQTRVLRNRVAKECNLNGRLDAKGLSLNNHQDTSDKSGNDYWKCDMSSKKSKKKPNAKNQPSAQDKNISDEVNGKDSLLAEKLDANNSILVDATVKTCMKIVQPINCLKRMCHGKESSLESSHTVGSNSGTGNDCHSGYMVHQLPSKFDMFAQKDSKSLVENKFGLATGRPVSSTPSQCRDNLLHLLMDNSFGVRGGIRAKKVILKAMSNGISKFSLVRAESPFDRRCTAMAWHPLNPNLVVVGSKGGDICLMNSESSSRNVFIQGCGLGGVIQAMKFVPATTTSLQLLTASMDGTVILRDLAVQSTLTTFVDTSDLIHQFWYCSCDVGPHGNMVVHGDSLGNATLQTMHGEKVWSHKLHRNKINHMEFHRKQEWLLCTASTDQYVRLWDIRMLKDKDGYLAQLKHDKGVNSAYFSQTDGNRLLTTDQHHELRVYDCGSWNLEQTIVHPHRFYQHLTPMKAAWHPLEDMIVCGRYPDKTLRGSASDDQHGIDFIDPFTTKNICRLYNPAANGIVTLAQFNNIGSTLAATMGYNILIWQKDDTLEEENKVKTSNRPYGFKSPDDSNSSQRNLQPKPKAKKTKLTSTNTKQLG